MTRLAEFRSLCGACRHWIETGQPIVRDNDSPNFIHAHCPEDPEAAADRAALASGRCPTCGLNHPGEC